jgi:hypothetical protein
LVGAHTAAVAISACWSFSGVIKFWAECASGESGACWDLWHLGWLSFSWNGLLQNLWICIDSRAELAHDHITSNTEANVSHLSIDHVEEIKSLLLFSRGWHTSFIVEVNAVSVPSIHGVFRGGLNIWIFVDPNGFMAWCGRLLKSSLWVYLIEFFKSSVSVLMLEKVFEVGATSALADVNISSGRMRFTVHTVQESFACGTHT